jgi:hypothetical protein
MATIDRPSLEKNLETRYETQPVGGAYNAKDIVRQGGNVVSLGGSTFETNYTVTKGFKTKMATGVTELKDATGARSKQLSLYMQGFNNKPYKR